MPNDLAAYVVEAQDWVAAMYTSMIGSSIFAYNPQFVVERSREEVCQEALLHDIFGNPFHPLFVDPALLTWSAATIPKLAQGIYTDRAFDRLPILADALEDAGCDNADILAHCRSGGEHVRGCWVVDLILGKA